MAEEVGLVVVLELFCNCFAIAFHFFRPSGCGCCGQTARAEGGPVQEQGTGYCRHRVRDNDKYDSARKSRLNISRVISLRYFKNNHDTDHTIILRQKCVKGLISQLGV